MELLVQPGPVPAAGVQILVHHVTVVDEEHRQRRVLRRRAGGLAVNGAALAKGSTDTCPLVSRIAYLISVGSL